METRCEACKRLEPSGVVQDGQVMSHRLCDHCLQWLDAFILSPRKWTEYSKRVGNVSNTPCDEFEIDPETDSEPLISIPELTAAPLPESECNRYDPYVPVRWCITWWKLQEGKIGTWRFLGPETTSADLRRVFEDRTMPVKPMVQLVIVWRVGDPNFEAFLRESKRAGTNRFGLYALAAASSAEFAREGLRNTIFFLDGISTSDRNANMSCLGYFRSQEVLDWIEARCDDPSLQSWGDLAALSRPDWIRISKWFDSGWPLSHVAIDTLLAIARPETPLLREARPVLENAPPFELLRQRLEALRAAGDVPVPQDRIAAILSDPSWLVSQSPPGKP